MADKEVIRENIVEADGVRAYELDGLKVTMPADWDDNKKQAWLEGARQESHLRRNLKMIRKGKKAELLGRAFRLHGDE